MSRKQGLVSLVGAGPGDPALLSLRAAQILGRADAVLYDALVHPDVLLHCSDLCEKIFVGKRAGHPSARQDKINRELGDRARAGQRVVRLKGGDPMLFSRGSEEAEWLAEQGIAFEIISAPCAPLAVAAYAGIPLTHRNLASGVTFITATESEEKDRSSHDWSKLATATETLVILMGLRKLDSLMRLLIEHGRPAQTPAAVVEWASLPKQRVVTGTVGTIAALATQAQLQMPATTIIGDVVDLREKLSWYERRPLFGKRILVPRLPQQAQALCDKLRERGAEAIALPLLKVVAAESNAALKDALVRALQFDWLVFTSHNAVQFTFAALRELGKDARALGNARVAAMGSATAAALLERGVIADLIATQSTSEGLAAELVQHPQWNAQTRVLVPQADNARSVLVDLLQQNAQTVESVVAYRNLALPQQDAERLRSLFTTEPPDAVLFTAGSTVRNLLRALGSSAREALKNTTHIAIGEITAQALRAAQLEVHALAKTTDDDGLVEALESYYAQRRTHGVS